MNKTIEEYLKTKKNEKVEYTCEDCGKQVSRTSASFHTNPHLKCKACFMLQKYGVTSNIQRESAQEKKRETFQRNYNANSPLSSNAVREKCKKTCLEKYGVDNIFKRTDIVTQACINKLGVSRPAQDPKIMEKIMNTNKQNHGGVYNFQDPECRKRIEDTLEKKYGTRHYGVSTGYHKKAHKGYFYKEEHFDSSWELAYWIYCQDNKIDIRRNTTPHKLSNGHNIYFDFIVNGRYVEIKGDYLKTAEDWPYKLEAYTKYDVKVMYEKDMKPIFSFIYKRYGKNYLKKFKNRQSSDFKRKIFEYDELSKEKFLQYKHKNARYHYICSECSKDVYAVWFTIDRNRDHLCKTCRNRRRKNNTNYTVEEVENKTSTKLENAQRLLVQSSDWKEQPSKE